MRSFIETVVIVAALCGLLYGLFCFMEFLESKECNEDQYLEVKEMVKYNDDMKLYVREALADGILSHGEYERLKRQVPITRKARLQTEIKEIIFKE